jgi:hypothetical protein
MKKKDRLCCLSLSDKESDGTRQKFPALLSLTNVLALGPGFRVPPSTPTALPHPTAHDAHTHTHCLWSLYFYKTPISLLLYLLMNGNSATILTAEDTSRHQTRVSWFSLWSGPACTPDSCTYLIRFRLTRVRLLVDWRGPLTGHPCFVPSARSRSDTGNKS